MTTPSTDAARPADDVPEVATSDAADAISLMPSPDAQIPAPAGSSIPDPPPDLAAFWEGIDAELARLPAMPEFEALPLHSTDFSTTYRVRMTSIGPYRIAAYLSIPHGDGPFPALMLAPGYGSVVTPPPYEDRQRYAVLSLMHRGTRGADRPYAAAFPGLLTDGIEAIDTWRYRGILADCLRGFEVLIDRPEVDRSRVAIQGSDIALLIAARRPEVTAVALGATFFHRLRELYRRTEAYPFEEINDHFRANPGSREHVDRTLGYVDPLYLADSVHAHVLIAVGEGDGVGSAAWFAPLIARLAGHTERYPITHQGQTDRDAVDRWLAIQLGSEPKPRLWEPQEIGPWP